MKMKIVVVGVGALGSHFMQFARNFDAEFTLIDFDRVEQKNVKSQFHGKPSVGKNKVMGLAQSLQFLFGLKIKTNPHKMVTDNVEAMLGGADLVLDCLDNGEARRTVQKFVRKAGIPCLHGALAPDGTFGQIVWDANFEIDDEDVAGAATCEGGEFLPFIALVSSYMAFSVQQFIEEGRQIGFYVHKNGASRL
jgi:molybdopterin/thiamine biosynthesis adenylyltransferase